MTLLGIPLLVVAWATAKLSAIIALRYVALSGIAYWWLWGRPNGAGRQLNRDRPDRAGVLRELKLSLISSPIYAAPAAIAMEAWKRGGTAMYTDPGQYGWLWLPASALLLLVLQDTYYYWTHRLMHHRRLFRWFHQGHHVSRQPTPFAAFAFDPAEALVTAWLLPLVVFFVPVHVGVAVAVLTFMSVNSVFNHAGRELVPESWVRGWFGAGYITATHHTLHHGRFTCNYGLYFRFWDRLMGTDRMPEPAARSVSASVSVGSPASTLVQSPQH